MDLALMGLVLLVAVGGFIRGTVRQAFTLLGLVAAVMAASWIARWVGLHWLGARPAVVFWALRWLVALLGGLAVVSAFEWVGNRLAGAVHGSAAGWVDRAGGFVLGAALGTLLAAVVLASVLLAGWPGAVREAALGCRLRQPVLSTAERVCTLGDRLIPGSAWLGRRLETARRAKPSARTNTI